MNIYLDSGDSAAVQRVSYSLPIAGVTTNPSILARGKLAPETCLTQLRVAIGPDKPLFAQVLAETAEEMVHEARALYARDRATVVKIPVTREGLAAIGLLRGSGIPTLGTAVYGPIQGLLAALAGAAYVAPYVNRIDAQGGSGLQCVRELQSLLSQHAPDCQMLAASFKSPRQVLDCMLAGCRHVTLAVDIAEQLLQSPAVDAAVAQFKTEWEQAFGQQTIGTPQR
ncbi:fructose-6-phosphate aldolase [Sodalis endosymbiont of Spalangia cameroni]|uniref:fructose-6-phosphate aldolase n=1 Tax=Sodalis praecaptivus TaxID=1239307 RepID=UPI0031FA0EFC